MLKIRHLVIVLGILICSTAFAAVQVSIGINLPIYPELVAIPGYPAYYAPRLGINFFFYDGMYWVYQDDGWYVSFWYNGPWEFVEPASVPVFILRIPVRYYRRPPPYFRGWRPDAPPHWGDHWGHDWEERRSGWDRWNRSGTPARAPLPVYQRQYSGERYPREMEQQQELHKQNYRYQPRDTLVRQHNQERAAQKTSEEKSFRQQNIERSMPRPREDENSQRATPSIRQQEQPKIQEHRRLSQPELDQREQSMPRSQGREERQQERDFPRELKRERPQEQGTRSWPQ